MKHYKTKETTIRNKTINVSVSAKIFFQVNLRRVSYLKGKREKKQSKKTVNKWMKKTSHLKSLGPNLLKNRIYFPPIERKEEKKMRLAKLCIKSCRQTE